MDYRQLKQQMKSQNERFDDLIEKCRAGSDNDHASPRENIEHRLEESFAALVERYKSGSDYEPTD